MITDRAKCAVQGSLRSFNGRFIPALADDSLLSSGGAQRNGRNAIECESAAIDMSGFIQIHGHARG